MAVRLSSTSDFVLKRVTLVCPAAQYDTLAPSGQTKKRQTARSSRVRDLKLVAVNPIPISETPRLCARLCPTTVGGKQGSKASSKPTELTFSLDLS
jgi:hypothetical protein